MDKGTDIKDDIEQWKDGISAHEKIHYELLFYSQGPVDGYLSGDRARDIFLHSRLPLTVLSQIWNLADVSNDNVLSCEEFVLAMHLILKVKDGLPVPRRLPKHLVPSSQPHVEVEDISESEREAYQNVFNRLNLEYIDAIQGRQLLLESKLPVEELSAIWDLSDIDRNGQLDKDEWAVSCHLIRNLKKGVKLNGPIDVFKWIPHRLSPVSYQARKHRVDDYNRKKHHLMTQKEKRKTQIENETRRLELLKKRYLLHKELFEVSKTSSDLNIPEEEFLLYKEKEESNIEKVEAIVYRLKKEHEKIRQETVKVILGEQGSLQEDARLVKVEQDEVKHRLLTTHTKATKDPDPFHELYELRKELRKRSTLSEGEEPEVHFPFVVSPFERDSLQPKFSGDTIFVHPNPSVLNNNNSNHKKLEVLKDLCEFGEGFLEKWASGKDTDRDSCQDSIFMSINVPMDARVWSGIKWGENMDASNIQSLHIRLVDLKEEMEKLNEDTGGQLLFRNPDDYLARKKAQEEEEKQEKSKFHRRSAGQTEKEFKRRSYAAPPPDNESKLLLSERRQKRRSLNLDKQTEKATDKSSIPDIPTRSHRKSNVDQKNKENQLSANTKQSETFSPVSASSPRSAESSNTGAKDQALQTTSNPEKVSTSATRPSTKRKAAPPPPQSPPKAPPIKNDEIDSASKNLTAPVEQTNESKIPKFVGVTENTTDNTHPSRPPRRKKKEENKSFLHDSFEKENLKGNREESESVSHTINGVVLKSDVDELITNKTVESPSSEREDSLLDSVIKELPSLKSSKSVKNDISDAAVKTEVKTVPVREIKEEAIIAKTDDGLELAIKPEKTSREKGKFVAEDNPTRIELKEKDYSLSKPSLVDSDGEQDTVRASNAKEVEIEVDEPDSYLDHIKPVAFKKQVPAEDLDQAFEKIAFLSDIKKSKESKDTISIASDISSAGSEPPPLPDSAPPSVAELFPKTQSLTEISETMEVAVSQEIEQAAPVTMKMEEDKQINGELELSPVMSPISELKSISMRVTSPTREKGGDITTNGGLTLQVGDAKKTLDYDSDMSDMEGETEVGSFTPGEMETKNIPLETQGDDGTIQLLSYSAKLHSPNSDQSGPDSAFEDMQSSMTSNDPLSSTLEDIVQEEFVVSEKAVTAETTLKVNTETKSDTAQKSSKPQRSEFKSVPGTKDFVTKAQQFADVIQKPPNMRVKLKREIASPEDLTDAAYLKLEAERRAVISSSTVKKKGIDLTAQYSVEQEDTHLEPVVITPDEAAQEWRSDVSKRANIDWEDKPDKVDLYSHNVIQENGNTEAVDRESIANLSTTRKQWENILKSNDTDSQSQKKTVTQVRHWEVKLPTKSKVVPVDTVRTTLDSDSDVENEAKMEDPENMNESAIEREIRLAMEREELLRKEKEERSQIDVGPNMASKTAFEQVEENNNKPTYHEMTEADRGSELQQREELIQQELAEQMEREAAIRGDVEPDDETSSQSLPEDEFANESIIEREIRMQQERERELEHSRKQNRMSKPSEPVLKPEVTEEQVTVVEELVTVEHSEPVRSSPTPVSTPAISTPDDLSEAEDQPVEVRTRITYEEAIANASHEGESLIARELREAREREEELAQQRQRLSGSYIEKASSPASKESETSTSNVSNHTVTKATYQNDVSPYKKDRRHSQDSLSSHSTEKSQPKVITPRTNIRVTSFGDKVYNRTPERKESPRITEKRETPIEKEIRLARERENELRVAKGLPPLQDEKKVEVTIEQKKDEEPSSKPTKSPSHSHNSSSASIRKMASSRLQKEIDKQTALEKKYRDEGRIKSTSEEHVGLIKYTEIAQENPPKRNFTVNKKTVQKDTPVEQNGTSEEKPQTVKPPTPQAAQSKFGRSVSGGGLTFSYRESSHQAESKIEQELREMREREEELRSQRAAAGYSPRNPDSPRSPTSKTVENKRSQFEQKS